MTNFFSTEELNDVLRQVVELNSGLANEGVKQLFKELGYPECDVELGLKLDLCEYGYDLTGLFNGTEETRVVWFYESTYGFGIKL
jgi:hypothetical protein